MIFAGAGSPLSEAKAIGLHGPVTEADLDRMEAAFFGRGETARVVVCPLADPSFVAGLGRRGYRLAGFENFLILALPLGRDDAEPPLTPGIEVRPIDPGEADSTRGWWPRTSSAPANRPRTALEMTVTMLGTEHASAFLAFIDGEPVGGGAVLIHRGLALLAGAATLPAYRNRGVQAGLVPRPPGPGPSIGVRPGRPGGGARQYLSAECRASWASESPTRERSSSGSRPDRRAIGVSAGLRSRVRTSRECLSLSRQVLQ